MKPDIVITYDGEMLGVRFNKKPLVYFKRTELYRRTEEFPGYLDGLLSAFQKVVEATDSEIEESALLHFDCHASAPSVGPCSLCGRRANLLGGICWNCKERGQSEG
jgi:hypothetical protein